jgi:RluA family pseudouridine synthase
MVCEVSMRKKDIEIIEADNDIVVVNKPAGISVTADRTGREDIITILSRQLKGQEGLRLVHRLDKHASGVLVIAKNRETQSELSRCFAKRMVKKSYLALAAGYVSDKEGVIDVAIARSRKDVRMMCVSGRRGKAAVTRWRLLADFGGVVLLEVEPVTGRTHQIRVHLAHKHMPLAIDPLYGSSKPLMLSDFKVDYRAKREREEVSLIDRLTLHAYGLEIPVKGKSKIYMARLDKKFAATIKMLDKHGPTAGRAFLESGQLSAILEGRKL